MFIQSSKQTRSKGNQMTSKIQITAKNEKEIDNQVIAISKKHPNEIVHVYARLGKITVTIQKSQPRTDCPSTVQTFQTYGGFFKNGRVVKPNKSWFNRHNFIPVMN